MMYQKDVLQQIVKASHAIRQKHKMLKTGQERREREILDTFHPIVEPLQRLVTNQTKNDEEISNVKKEENLNLEEETPQFPSQSKAEDLLDHYISLLQDDRKRSLDRIYGVKKRPHDKMSIGNSEITFTKNQVVVNDIRYPITVGLLDLLFKKTVDVDNLTTDDLQNYKQILISSNAHLKNYDSSQPIKANTSYKYLNVIRNLFPKPKFGRGLIPKYMIENEHNIDYLYWDDANELVDRLRLLLSSQSAGNLNHGNEIMAIIEELREANIIY